MRRKTHDTFIEEMKDKHPNLEVLSEYVNSRTKVHLKCRVCEKEFDARPSSLCFGNGCPHCAGVAHKSNNEYIEEMSYIHPDIVVLGEYRSSKAKVQLKCIICDNEWSATPNSSLEGRGCPYCAGLMKKTHNQFVKEMKSKHPQIEVLGTYENNKTKVKCKCMKCGQEFSSQPHSMLNAWRGCPRCSISIGEKSIRSWLIENNIEYIQEYSFSDCRDKRVLPFDFYLPNENIAIEFDGKQHFTKNDYWGGKDALKVLQRHDRIKNDYCSTHNIKLVRIPYWDFKNISSILSKELTI